MQPSSAEYTVTRTYLEWLVELPWSTTTEDKLDIQAARDILNDDHYDLEKVKKRILEYLAVRKLKSDKKGPILCLVGPARRRQDVARPSRSRASLGRKFVRISLGGVRDEAEIRGHRRTYVGSLPGRLIQGMKKAGSNNPVFMLDEIDKLGHDFRGDPAAALLEVLDPEQNHTLLRPLPRGAVRPVEGHVRRDRQHHRPDPARAARPPGGPRAAGLHARGEAEHRASSPHPEAARGARPHDREGRLRRRAVAEVIDSYTREAGVRNLEREIANVCRAIAVLVAEGKAQPIEKRHAPSDRRVPRAREVHLGGRRARRPSRASPRASPGRRWAATSSSSRPRKMNGKGQLVLTGQLGDVMKESAQAALSFIRSRADAGWASTRTSSRRPTSTSTSRRAPSRRTVPRRA